eukprot:1824583-Rhodomonas_salina.1
MVSGSSVLLVLGAPALNVHTVLGGARGAPRAVPCAVLINPAEVGVVRVDVCHELHPGALFGSRPWQHRLRLCKKVTALSLRSQEPTSDGVLYRCRGAQQ